MRWYLFFLFILFLPATAAGGTMERESKQVYVYYYFMDGKPDTIRQVVPEHIEYWKSLNLNRYQGGPFADRSGGMIVFEAESKDKASKAATGDPFVVHGLIGKSWLKPWIVH